MRSAVDPHSIANEIRMSRTVRRHAAALLVEGSKDMRVFRNLVDESSCEIVATDGKRNALGALNVLRRSGQRGILAIVDSDFSKVDGQQIIDPDILTTDLHDIEAMVLKSPAPQKLMIEYDLAVNKFGADVGHVVAKAVVPLGYLRLVSLKQKLSLGFADLDFKTFVDPGPPVAIDSARLVRETLKRNPRCKHNEAALSQMMTDAKHDAHDQWHVGCGHDMTAVFATLLSKELGREIQSYTIERQLRLAYQSEHFAATSLFAAIRDWEQRNQPYVILR